MQTRSIHSQYDVITDDGIIIYCGERQSGSIPERLSMNEWFGNDAWINNYTTNLIRFKFRVLGEDILHSKRLVRFATYTCAFLTIAGAVYFQKKMNAKLEPVTQSQQANENSSRMRAGQIGMASNTKTNSPDEKNNLVPKDHKPVVDESIGTIQSFNASPIQIIKREDAIERVEPKKLTLAEKMASTQLPSPMEMKLTRVKPPLPQLPPAAVPKSTSTKQRNLGNGIEPPMMVIHDEHSKETIAPATVGSVAASASVAATSPASAHAEITKPEQHKAIEVAPLPTYKIVTMTKNSVVIADPVSKLPKQFFVGSSLPSGEIVKSVNEDTGVIVTNARTFKMK